MDGKGKVLVHDYSGHPFQVQLSRELARRGYNVLHVYSKSFQTPRGFLARKPGDPANFQVFGIELSGPFAKYSFVRRWFQEREYGRLLARKVSEFKPDVVVSCNTPLDPQRVLLEECGRLGIRFVFWVQDLYGVAIDRILRRSIPLVGGLIGRHYMRLEGDLLRRSDAVVLITEDFMQAMEKLGVDKSKVSVVRNWAPLDEVAVLPKSNGWSRANGLEGEFCFMYSGTLGLKHNPGVLLELALHFRDDDRVRVVVVSEGLGADYLREKGGKLGLKNLVVLGFQPFERFGEVLASADVLVAAIEPDAGIYSVPSKVLTYMCARRPLLLAVPKENLAGRIVCEANAGLVCEPHDMKAVLDAALRLRSDDGLRGALAGNARAYAEKNFGIKEICGRFEAIINKPSH